MLIPIFLLWHLHSCVKLHGSSAFLFLIVYQSICKKLIKEKAHFVPSQKTTYLKHEQPTMIRRMNNTTINAKPLPKQAPPTNPG